METPFLNARPWATVGLEDLQEKETVESDQWKI
jgi:hypothetical protein